MAIIKTGFPNQNECVCFGLTGCADEELFSEKCTHLPTWHSRVVPLRCPARVSSARNGTRSLQSGGVFLDFDLGSNLFCGLLASYRFGSLCDMCKPLTAGKTKHPRTIVTGEKIRQAARSIAIFMLPVHQRLHKLLSLRCLVLKVNVTCVFFH